MFFDDEAVFILRRWLRVREGVNRRKETALFLSTWGFRISRNDVYLLVTKAAERVGLHDPDSERMKRPFQPPLRATLEYYIISTESRNEERIRPMVAW